MQLFLKLDDFFWREHLSTLGLPYGIKGSELQLLKVLAVTANYQVPANIDNLECRTCVVIGNGFAIKNTSLGGIINKYDVVIRLNDAPVRGYEDDVGNKTTMRFFYPESASYNPGLNNEPDTLMVLVPFKQQDLRWLKEILYNEKRVRKGFWKPPPQIWLGDVAQIRVLDPYFLQQTAEKLLQIPLNPKSKQEKACHIFETLKKQKGNEAKKEELTASNVCFERVGACGNLQNVKVQDSSPSLANRRPPDRKPHIGVYTRRHRQLFISRIAGPCRKPHDPRSVCSHPSPKTQTCAPRSALSLQRRWCAAHSPRLPRPVSKLHRTLAPATPRSYTQNVS
ncbi:CMP-N-acetylneuraminate-beta-galactosamide-alpha-2,3-sialyltransferase 4 isoform X5 [Syngnathoides biaculeatus]|nr:CMP-N-acetylneuraminate-beta-galactosamide-alpha-2,3-sialyltransferase 4 isoform X5 [Syngnathoides biaculeatus]